MKALALGCMVKVLGVGTEGPELNSLHPLCRNGDQGVFSSVLGENEGSEKEEWQPHSVTSCRHK